VSRGKAYAVLLRGVNVGGYGKLPMKTFAAVLEELGCGDVKTYLQSGNAVLTSTAPATRLASDVQQALRGATGLDIPVLVRTAADLARIVDGWPFDANAEPRTRHVVFLRSAADAKALVDLPLDDLLPDRLHVAGIETYLFLPDGLGRSKLAAKLSARQKGTAATTRNWNTVTALRDLAAAIG
jgi:uncharacterized protein (DUF1697 family)